MFFDDTMRAQQLWEHHAEENMETALSAENFTSICNQNTTLLQKNYPERRHLSDGLIRKTVLSYRDGLFLF